MVRKRSCLSLGGTRVDIWEHQDVLAEVASRLQEPSGAPLFVASANLDHISHFGQRGCSRDLVDFEDPSVRWLVLLDGVPLVWRSRRLLEEPVEQLAGSDLLSEVLHVSSEVAARVGVLGGAPETHTILRDVLAVSFPGLLLVECWAPSRSEINDPVRCGELAEKVAAADIDLLVVALGKPRQERFLAEHGLATGARVALAFGAAIDFLAGQVPRAPERVRRAGMEWLWRLVQEPRRLARRYLVAGPPGAAALLRDSSILCRETMPTELPSPQPGTATARVPRQRTGIPGWTGVERRSKQRRTMSRPIAAADDVAIPGQRGQDHRTDVDRRVQTTAGASSGERLARSGAATEDVLRRVAVE